MTDYSYYLNMTYFVDNVLQKVSIFFMYDFFFLQEYVIF